MMRQTGVEVVVVVGREEGRGATEWTLAKNNDTKFLLFLFGDFSLPVSQSGVPRCLEVRLGLPGFENRVLFVRSPQSLPSLNNLVGGVPLSLFPSLCSYSVSLPLLLSLSLSPSPVISIHQQRAVTLSPQKLSILAARWTTGSWYWHFHYFYSPLFTGEDAGPKMYKLKWAWRYLRENVLLI